MVGSVVFAHMCKSTGCKKKKINKTRGRLETEKEVCVSLVGKVCAPYVNIVATFGTYLPAAKERILLVLHSPRCGCERTVRSVDVAKYGVWGSRLTTARWWVFRDTRGRKRAKGERTTERRGGGGGAHPRKKREEARAENSRIGSHVPVTVLQVHKKRNFRLS